MAILVLPRFHYLTSTSPNPTNRPRTGPDRTVLLSRSRQCRRNAREWNRVRDGTPAPPLFGSSTTSASTITPVSQPRPGVGRLFRSTCSTAEFSPMCELNKLILEARTALYGDDHSEPVAEICAQLTQEFFRDDMLRLLIICLPKLDSGARQDAAHVVKNLHGQRVNSRLIASDYMEENADLVDILVPGYDDSDLALSYGAILRDCIRHQIVAWYLLESEHVKKFFDYMQNPNFEIASDAAATFKELLTRHKLTVADFLLRNYQWFFQEYNSRLLESPNYVTRRHAVKLLGEILTDRSNSSVMVHYVSSLDNMRVLMNLLRDSNKTIQLDAFQVFKLFINNQNKPPEIVSILVKNRIKLLQFFGDFELGKKDEAFEADKAQVVKDLAFTLTQR